PNKTKPARFDVVERTAVNPSIILFFIKLTFGGITSFLPLYVEEQGFLGIQFFFIFISLYLLLLCVIYDIIYKFKEYIHIIYYIKYVLIIHVYAEIINDKKGDMYFIPPGTILIFSAILLLSWLPNMPMMLVAGALYGLGFGSVQPALQAWAVDKAPKNRKGMANATFFSFFDLGVGVGAILFGQLAFMFNYGLIYIVAACSVLIALSFYLFLVGTGRRKLRH